MLRHTVQSPLIHKGKIIYSAHIDKFVLNNLPALDDRSDVIVCEHGHGEKTNAASVLLDNMAILHGNKICIHYGEHYWTYNDLLHKSNQIARYIVEQHGFKPGNRLLIHSHNTPMQIACWFAGIKAGGVCVLTMPLLRSTELSYIIKKSQITHFLCENKLFPEALDAVALSKSSLTALSFSAYGDDHEIIDRACIRNDYHFSNVLTSLNDPAIIAFTSGTTSSAKGVVHHHGDLLAICEKFPKSILQLNSQDVCCGTPPIGFTFGLGALVLFPLRFGASSVLLEDNTIDHLLKTLKQHPEAVFFSNPTLYLRILNQMNLECFTELRHCVSAGEHLSRSTFIRWQEATGRNLINAIGSTELLHIFMSTCPSDSEYRGLGKALDGFEAKLIDTKGNVIENESPGHLAIKGPVSCKYLNNQEDQRKYVNRGWNMTGDICIQKSDGSFWYQSRADDLIISSGYNISGYEIEDILLGHPHIQECAVVGVNDNDRGQIVKAYIVLKQGVSGNEALAKEIQLFVKQKIAPYKYPRAIEFLSKLPKTNNGKIKRSALRYE